MSSFSIPPRTGGARALGHLPKQAMNRLEADYATHLEYQRIAPGAVIEWKFEAIKLILADNTSYLPDFFVQTKDLYLEVHEVKGHWEDDARVKIKVAARQFPWFTFIGVTRPKKSEGWVYEKF